MWYAYLVKTSWLKDIIGDEIRRDIFLRSSSNNYERAYKHRVCKSIAEEDEDKYLEFIRHIRPCSFSEDVSECVPV